MGALPPVFIEFLGSATGFHATARGVRTELAGVEATGGGSMARLGAVSKAALLGIGVAAGVAAVKTVHMAADFQTQITRIRTSAGETAQNMHLISQGVLELAGSVGESTSDLTKGLYNIESAGYHGASGLDVLRVSAEGAKVGNADLFTVADAVTTAMNAYKVSASGVTGVMNALIATEVEGKNQMEDLAGAMSGILPVAAAAHVGMNEVLGAMATMTIQGTSAKVAATYLRQTIGQLSNPTAKARNEMRSLGLDSVQVSKNLGTNGLASTLIMLTDAIEKHMGPAGTVLIDRLKSVSGNATEFQKVLANLPPTQQTFIGALATMVGGTKSMMAALQLTGPHMEDFQRKTKNINDHVKEGGKTVEGWSAVQKTFNQRMSEAKGSVEALGIQIGTALLPTAMRMIDLFSASFEWFTKHRDATYALAIAIGTILVIGLIAATVAVTEFTIALFANPLTWIVLGIMALVAAIVLLVIHWSAISDWIKGVWHSTISGVVDLWHWLADETTRIWNDKIVAPLKAAWKSVADAVVAGWHAVVDPIVGAWNATWAVTTRVWDAISGFFRKWWPLLFVIFFPYIAILVAAWNHFHQAVFDATVSAWNAVLGVLKTVWGWISDQARTAWALTREFIVTPIQEAYRYLTGIAADIANFLSSKWDSVHHTASSKWAGIKAAILAPLNAAWGQIASVARSIGTAISNGLQAAYNKVTSIGDKFWDIGVSIVKGIVRGVGDAAGLLTSKLKGLANDALGAAKSFLGINSPSKVFAAKVGTAIPEGIALGIQQAGHMVGSAVKAVTGPTAIAPEFGPGRLAVAGGGGGVTHNHYHVEVHGSVIAERDLSNTVQRVMGQLGARNPQSYPNYKR